MVWFFKEIFQIFLKSPSRQIKISFLSGSKTMEHLVFIFSGLNNNCVAESICNEVMHGGTNRLDYFFIVQIAQYLRHPFKS